MTSTYGAWRLVAGREVTVRVRSKAFWISSVIMVVLIIGGALALHFASGQAPTYHLAVTSTADANLITSVSPSDAPADATAATFVPVVAKQQEAAEALVRDGTADAALVPADDGWLLISKGEPAPALSQFAVGLAQLQGLTANTQRLGVPLSEVLDGTSVTTRLLERDADKSMMEFAITIAFGVLFFMSCQLFGNTIAGSVVEEKESRVIEVLLSALPTRAVLLGKVLANAGLGVAQMVVFAAAALGATAAVGGLPYFGDIVRSSGWFLLYYVIGFLTMCFLFGGLGALVSRTQDLQAATAPLVFIVAATYMISIVGKGAVITVGSFVPIVSTVTMPARIFAGGVPWWQVALSLSLALAFAVVSVWIADRAYRSSVLKTGARIPLMASLRVPVASTSR